jgi:hypothetical protein
MFLTVSVSAVDGGRPLASVGVRTPQKAVAAAQLNDPLVDASRNQKKCKSLFHFIERSIRNAKSLFYILVELSSMSFTYFSGSHPCLACGTPNPILLF